MCGAGLGDAEMWRGVGKKTLHYACRVCIALYSRRIKNGSPTFLVSMPGVVCNGSGERHRSRGDVQRTEIFRPSETRLQSRLPQAQESRGINRDETWLTDTPVRLRMAEMTCSHR